MGSSCGNSDSITINENGENLNNNNHHQRHNQINNKSKKNDIQNKLSNLKDSDKFKEMPYYGIVEFNQIMIFILENV